MSNGTDYNYFQVFEVALPIEWHDYTGWRLLWRRLFRRETSYWTFR